MRGITEQAYAAWLEESLRLIYKAKPKAIVIAAIDETDKVITGYYNTTPQDKAIIASNIHGDIVMDIIKNNAAVIRDMMEGADDGTD